ncbi:MAG: HdeD family acid-resistance protein [Enterococcus sp.]
MKRFLGTFKDHAPLRAAIYLIGGIMILINPDGVFQIIVYLISGYIALLGIINCISGFKMKKQSGSYGLGLANGLIQIFLAILLLVFARTLVSVLPFILGLLIVLNGVLSFIQSLNGSPRSMGWLIYSVLLTIAGVVLVFNPFQSTMFLFQIFGTLLIIMGISEGIGFFKNR